MPRRGGLTSWPALLALTACWLDHTLEILFAVIVGDLFTRLYLLLRPNPNSASANNRFGIWLARVIDVPRNIATRAAVD